jgi:hypothetical protein
MAMTIDQFDAQGWTSGMFCTYHKKRRLIVMLDFEEKLVGLQNQDDATIVDWVRCENMELRTQGTKDA